MSVDKRRHSESQDNMQHALWVQSSICLITTRNASNWKCPVRSLLGDILFCFTSCHLLSGKCRSPTVRSWFKLDLHVVRGIFSTWLRQRGSFCGVRWVCETSVNRKYLCFSSCVPVWESWCSLFLHFMVIIVVQMHLSKPESWTGWRVFITMMNTTAVAYFDSIPHKTCCCCEYFGTKCAFIHGWK